jgi:hypothetical protein
MDITLCAIKSAKKALVHIFRFSRPESNSHHGLVCTTGVRFQAARATMACFSESRASHGEISKVNNNEGNVIPLNVGNVTNDGIVVNLY